MFLVKLNLIFKPHQITFNSTRNMNLFFCIYGKNSYGSIYLCLDSKFSKARKQHLLERVTSTSNSTPRRFPSYLLLTLLLHFLFIFYLLLCTLLYFPSVSSLASLPFFILLSSNNNNNNAGE